MEQVDLTVPVSGPTVTFYRVNALAMRWPTGDINIELADNLGATLSLSYTGAEGVALMTALNKANLSVKSLHKRIIEQLQADGKLPAGSISGTP